MCKPNKVVIIGLDAPIPERVYRYAVDGKLPNIKRLIEKGVYAENCLVPHPTITPPNWTTIVTGAWPGTHGVTCFNMHKPGMPLSQTYEAFDSSDCKAEYLWEAAERAGKKTLILNYPSTWPPRGKNVIQIGGAGLAINEWRTDPKISSGYRCTLCSNMLFSTEEYPLARVIELRKAEGWTGIPKDIARALEAVLTIDFPSSKFKVNPVEWHLLLLDHGEGFTEAVVSKARDFNKVFVVLKPGEWSPILRDEFKTEKGVYKAVFRLKLLELSRDGSKVKLYITPICALHGNSRPDGLVERIQEKSSGLPLPAHDSFRALNLGWIDVKTFLELVDMEHEWLADAACWLMENYDWDIFVMHAHCPDWAYHAFANKIDPSTASSEEEARLYGEVELAFYQSLDRMIGRILEAAGENALVVIVSDHGAKPGGYRFNPAKILEKAGLLVYKKVNGERVIDWERTLAVPQRSCYIYVNLKGRDPHGVVPPEKYEEVRDAIIKALYDYTDPKTGLKPVIFALKREDARVLGLYGDRIGDVVFAIRGEYGGQHGPHLTTVKYGIGSLKGLLIMAGPGVKEGFILKRTVWLTDVVPTLCYLAELPIPRDAEGGIIYQALKDPDAKVKELQRLRKNYQRLEEAFEKERSLTHTYFMEG